MISILHRKIRAAARDLAPLSLSLTTLALVGLGSRLADQWHLHAGPEFAFTHLHVVVGDHQHHAKGEHGQRHREPAAPSKESRPSGVLTVTVGAVTPPGAPAVERPIAVPEDHPVGDGSPVIDTRLPREASSPRAPPV